MSKENGFHPDDISPESIPGGHIVQFKREQSPLSEPISTKTYEALMQGQEVSWNQIIREHPMLGTITVPQLVNTGSVYVIPDYDPVTDNLDYRLIKLQKQNGRKDHTPFER